MEMCFIIRRHAANLPSASSESCGKLYQFDKSGQDILNIVKCTMDQTFTNTNIPKLYFGKQPY